MRGGSRAPAPTRRVLARNYTKGPRPAAMALPLYKQVKVAGGLVAARSESKQKWDPLETTQTPERIERKGSRGGAGRSFRPR